MNIDWNDPAGLEKLALKLRLSRILKKYIRREAVQIRNESGCKDQALFDACINELAKEGCLEKQTGKLGALWLEYKAGR
jgi:hypothetical protein